MLKNRRNQISDDAEGTESKKMVAEEEDLSIHEIEISVAVIPGQEIKEEAESKSRKHKNELEDLQAGVKYHNIITHKKQNLVMKESQVFLEKSWNKKEEK